VRSALHLIDAVCIMMSQQHYEVALSDCTVVVLCNVVSHCSAIPGSLLSPAHGATVRERYRTNPSEIIPSPHRLAVAQLLVQNSKLLSVDPWEITRRRAMDYLSLLEHVAAIIKDQLEGVDVKVLYVCKPNMVPKLSPQALRESNFGVVTVCRTHESDVLRNALTAKWNGAITVGKSAVCLRDTVAHSGR
jgi:hypothetical protein